MSPTFHREYLLRLPLPLAQLYSRAYNAKDARGRHDNTFYLFEALVKLAAAPAVAAYLHEGEQGGPRQEGLDRLLAQLALPSLGQWTAILRGLARYFGTRTDAAVHPLGSLWGHLTRERRDLPALTALYRRIKNGPDGAAAGDQGCSPLQVLEAMVQYRNGVFGHGAGRFESFYEREMGPLLFPAANQLLAEGVLPFLGPAGSRLVYLMEVRTPEEGRMEVELVELTGLRGERLPPLSLPAREAAGLAPGRVALLWPGRPLPLRLDPLLVYRESDLAEEVLFLNRDRNGRQVEYLSYTTGRTERDETPAPALVGLLSRVVGRPVPPQELQALAEQSRAETPSVEALFGPRPPEDCRLGDFEILAEIGRGGMGVVYLARQLSLGRVVALKMLPADLAGDSAAVARFGREIRALARCNHPHIIRVLTSGTLPDGRLFYAMEYVPGCDLERVWVELAGSEPPEKPIAPGGDRWTRAVLSATGKQRSRAGSKETESAPAPAAPRDGPLPPADPRGYARQVAQLGRDVARALQVVHEQGLVHRDVKPANLMLTPGEGRVVLMDFGLAKSASQGTTSGGAGGLLGTLRYAAPEQLAAASLPVGPVADVRGLGVTMWELLTRRRLFAEAADEVRLAQKVHEDDVPRLRTVDPTLDRDLEAIVARATERRVADRIPTAARLADYLQMYLDGQPLPIRPPGLVERTWRWGRKRRILVGALGAALLAVLLGVILSRTLIRQSRDVTRSGIADLREVDRLCGLGQCAEARAVLNRAEERQQQGGPAALAAGIRKARANLDMALRLDRILLNQGTTKSEDFEPVSLVKGYEAAFQEFGLEMGKLSPAGAAERIRGSAIRDQLLGALDRWAYLKKTLKAAGWESLATAARLADPDPKRKEVREVILQGKREDMERLAAQPETAVLPPDTLCLLARNLVEAGASPGAITLLEAGLRKHPKDFWLIWQLGFCLLETRSDRLSQAVSYFQAALALQPDSPEAHAYLGYALKEAGELGEAETVCNQAIRLQGNYPRAHVFLSMALEMQGKLPEAEKACGQALRLQPDFCLGLLQRGILLLDLEKPVEAEAVFRQALWLKPDLATAHSLLGIALACRKKGAAAEAACRRAIQLRPGAAEGYTILGYALLLLGKLDEAEAACQEAIRLEPGRAAGYGQLGAVLLARGRPGDAEVSFRQALHFLPHSSQFHHSLGLALLRQARWTAAEISFRQATQFRGNFALAFFNLAMVLEAQSRFPEAEAACREALRCKPDFALAFAHLGYVLLMEQRTGEAEAACRRALQLNPKKDEAYLFLGAVLETLGRPAEAKEAFRQAFAFGPWLPGNLKTFGDMQSDQGRLKEAEAAYRLALRLWPNEVETLVGLGLAQMKQEKLAEAEATFRQVIEVKADCPQGHINLGMMLVARGLFAEGLESLRRGHELGSKDPNWSWPSAQVIQNTELLGKMFPLLPDALRGKYLPKNAAESRALAVLCREPRHLYAASARFYADAFSSQLNLAAGSSDRFNAACAAAQAGAGKGEDGPGLDARERAHWRAQAVRWLRADLDYMTKYLDGGDSGDCWEVQAGLRPWLDNPELAGIRDEAELARLPEAERETCRRLWADVRALLKRAER